MLIHFAYIDAGTGSMFIQAALGTLLAVGVVFRSSIGKIIAKLRRSDSSSTADAKNKK